MDNEELVDEITQKLESYLGKLVIRTRKLKEVYQQGSLEYDLHNTMYYKLKRLEEGIEKILNEQVGD